jgi:hypothetical protein
VGSVYDSLTKSRKHRASLDKENITKLVLLEEQMI